MGRRFERDKNDVKYGWRYAADNSDVALIGGSSGYEIINARSKHNDEEWRNSRMFYFIPSKCY